MQIYEQSNKNNTTSKLRGMRLADYEAMLELGMKNVLLIEYYGG